jgi:ribosomal protein S18 acetylase RimI-like enzyme
MDECERIARDWGSEEVGLTVDPDNFEAIRFYEALGWEKLMRLGIWSGAMVKRLEK